MGICLYEFIVYVQKNEREEIYNKYQKELILDAELRDLKELFIDEHNEEIKNFLNNEYAVKIEIKKIIGSKNIVLGLINIEKDAIENKIPINHQNNEQISMELQEFNITKEQKELLHKINNKINKNTKIILDTNIFLHYINFVEVLIKFVDKVNSKIYIVNDTFDEICIKKDQYKYDTLIGKNSRKSLRLIEKLKDEGKIVIEGNIGYKIKNTVYADPKIIEWVNLNIKEYYIIAIINDTELRTRIKFISDKNIENIMIIELNENIWLK